MYFVCNVIGCDEPAEHYSENVYFCDKHAQENGLIDLADIALREDAEEVNEEFTSYESMI